MVPAQDVPLNVIIENTKTYPTSNISSIFIHKKLQFVKKLAVDIH
jgi:hypothetical protein